MKEIDYDKYYYNNDQFISYREVGEGDKTIILLHGFGASSNTWDDLIPLLCKSRHRMLLIDLIGYGFSSIPNNLDFSMAANAQAILGLIASKNIEQYSLIGHSFGGSVALKIALESIGCGLQKVESLILISPAAYNTGFPFFVKQLRQPCLGKLILKFIPPGLMMRFTLERIYFDKSKVTEEKVRRYTRFLSRPGYDITLLKSAEQIIPQDYSYLINQYKKIEVPTLIIWGKQDTSLSIEGGYRLSREMPNSRLILIDKSGHNIQEECPETLANAAKDFLDSIYKLRKD